jgi:hypothetical protein
VCSSDLIVSLDSFGALTGFYGRRAQGTNAAKTAITSGNGLSIFAGLGYDGSAYTGPAGRVVFAASEGWSGTAHGTEILFSTTPNGSTVAALANRWRITNDGHFVAVTDNASDIGASGATRPRNVFIGSALTVGTTVTAASIDLGEGAVDALAFGTYTPTLNIINNLSDVTAFSCSYSRVGNVVTVSGRIDVDPTLTATLTTVDISLPFASNFASSVQGAGTAVAPNIAGQCAAIYSNAATDSMRMEWNTIDIANQDMYFTFTYQII